MKYKQLQLKQNTDTITIEDKNSPINGVKVKQYLPIDDKTEIALTSVMQCFDTDLGVSFKSLMETSFMVSLVEKATDITFSKTEKKNLSKLYDEMESNGVFDEVISYMDENDYNDLVEFTENLLNQMIQKSNSVSTGMLNSTQTKKYVEEFVDSVIDKNKDMV